MVQMLGWSSAEAAWASCSKRCRVGVEVRRQKLKRHRALEPGIEGFVDDAHAAAAELL